MNTQQNQQLTAMVARYRRAAAMVAFALVLIGLVASALYARGDAPVTGPAATTVVVVQQGDTLWDLALQYGPPGADPRATVAQIRRANGIVGSLIYPGDALRVPRG
jgi:nucleoid-associated protein YgaU